MTDHALFLTYLVVAILMMGFAGYVRAIPLVIIASIWPLMIVYAVIASPFLIGMLIAHLTSSNEVSPHVE